MISATCSGGEAFHGGALCPLCCCTRIELLRGLAGVWMMSATLWPAEAQSRQRVSGGSTRQGSAVYRERTRIASWAAQGRTITLQASTAGPALQPAHNQTPRSQPAHLCHRLCLVRLVNVGDDGHTKSILDLLQNPAWIDGREKRVRCLHRLGGVVACGSSMLRLQARLTKKACSCRQQNKLTEGPPPCRARGTRRPRCGWPCRRSS